MVIGLCIQSWRYIFKTQLCCILEIIIRFFWRGSWVKLYLSLKEWYKSMTGIEISSVFNFLNFQFNQKAFDRRALTILFFPLQLGFTLGNVVGMYLAQNYDVCILVFLELNFIWIENVKMFSLNQNWISLYFDVCIGFEWNTNSTNFSYRWSQIQMEPKHLSPCCLICMKVVIKPSSNSRAQLL